MIDAIYFFRERSEKLDPTQKKKLLPQGQFLLLTLHRAENTDQLDRLQSIFEGLSKSPLPLLFPMHPRTEKALKDSTLEPPSTVQAIKPLSYLEMIFLQTQAQAVFTDSGGVQKEAVVLGKPCFTLRDETEWTETVEEGWNTLLGADPKKIQKALQNLAPPPSPFPTVRYYGDGRAADKIARILANS